MCESELPVMSDIFEVYDFENEQHWLKGRTNGIGGSDASAVVGMNPYKSNIDLFEEKIGRVRAKDISDKPCVIYGKKAEEYIRELFKLDYPEYKVEHHEFRILRSKEHPFMQASLDGELTDSEGRRGVLEIKTTNILQSMQYEKWKDRIPDNYYIQVLHYLLVTGWQFVVLRAHLNTEWGGEKRTTVKHYFIERADVEADLQMLQEEEQKFWRYVESGRKPPLILPEI
ncbi:recombinase [Dorea formicigenerans]|jgi:putative phage-type endonuclease|uniref:Recombinase n=2 Tax=Dorea formicigenerans TaxID=39486 RepID=A0A3E4F532_9FIRM|nr:recombinase [Dorea formicigenerans]RGI87577.1 recombinase [Dorea formicigenerans]